MISQKFHGNLNNKSTPADNQFVIQSNTNENIFPTVAIEK